MFIYNNATPIILTLKMSKEKNLKFKAFFIFFAEKTKTSEQMKQKIKTTKYDKDLSLLR